MLSDEGGKDAAEAGSETDDVFLKKIEATMLTQVRIMLVMQQYRRSACQAQFFSPV